MFKFLESKFHLRANPNNGRKITSKNLEENLVKTIHKGFGNLKGIFISTLVKVIFF